jgi:hypothetical protein
VTELQKQVISATWKLKRTAPAEPTEAFKADAIVVKESQADALAQAEEASVDVDDPRLAAAWNRAKAAMTEAHEALEGVPSAPARLADALTAEQVAQQALLAVRAREFQVNRNRQNSGGQAGASEQMQQQLDEMELTEEENRYELERQAEAPQEAERREQRQVLNRLQELARRQEDVNKRLQELQTALQAAETEAAREELKRELKRLEDEQRQMLADVDELNQRMQRPENQSRMAQEQQRLEEARENVRQASEATAEGNAAQALASGTRARREFEEMREELRRKSSSAFAEELREMRAEARDLASRQQKVTEQLQRIDQPAQRSLADTPEREAAIRALADQRQRTERLTKKATEISEGAESAEPLVSRQLYDTMRTFAQDDAATVKEMQEAMIREGRMTNRLYENMLELQQEGEGARALGLTSDLVEQDLPSDARASGTRAQSGIEAFRAGIERASESVLGDDTEALRRADRDLAELTRVLEEELAAADNPRQPRAGQGREPRPGEPSGSAEPGAQPGQPRDGQPGNVASAASTEAGPRQGTQGGRQPGEPETPEGESTDPNRPGDQPGEGDPSQTAARQPGQGGPSPQGAGRNGENPEGEAAPRESQSDQGRQAGTDRNQPGQGRPNGNQPGEGQPGEGQPDEGQVAQSGQGQGQPGEGQQAEGQQGEGQGGGGRQAGGQRGQRGQRGGGQGGLAGGEAGTDPTGETGDAGSDPAQERPGQAGGTNGDRRTARAGGSLGGGGRATAAAPITGGGFGPWSDGLRDVEEMVEFPELRDGIARARERARLMRIDLRRGQLEKPDWAVVRTEVVNPLVEVRQGLREELARRASSEALVPIDRDPVPGRYSEQVRRYYEQLGKDQ